MTKAERKSLLDLLVIVGTCTHKMVPTARERIARKLEFGEDASYTATKKRGPEGSLWRL